MNWRTASPYYSLSRSTLIAAMALLLGACMGDDDSSSSRTSPQSNVELPPIVMNESSVYSRDLSDYLDDSSAEVEIDEEGQEFVGGRFEGSSLSLETGGVDSPRSAKIRLLDGDRVVGYLDLSVNPVTTGTVEEEADYLLREEDQLLSLREPAELYRHLVDVAYWTGNIGNEKKQELKSDWNPSANGTYSQLESALADLRQAFMDYRNSSVSFSSDDLRHYVDATLNAANQHAGQVQSMINELPQSDAMPPMPSIEYRYNADDNSVSAFIGDSGAGYWQDGEWSFHPEMGYLQAVMNKAHYASCGV